MSGALKVLVTGASGQLARALCNSVAANTLLTAVTHAELDISNLDAVRQRVNTLHPDIIINAAAYTAVDKAESEPTQATVVNVTGARNLAIAASELGNSRLIHVSTDFVFDGRANRAYAVDSPTNPQSIYGKTKYDGECAVRDVLGDQSLIVRTAWVYDHAGKNFVRTMLRLMNAQGVVRVVADQIGTPTAAASLAEMVWKFVTQPELSGVYHWTDAGVASWYDFAVAIAEEAIVLGLLQREVSVVPITTLEYPTPAMRPAFSVLDKSKTYTDLGVRPVHWRQELRKVMERIVAENQRA